MQYLVNTTYVRLMALDLSDFGDLRSYPTLNALFTRQFIQPRVCDADPNRFISPADGLITAQGQLEGDTLLQIKGMTYAVSDLLTAHATHRQAVIGGEYVNFYLSPSDYHGYHAPTTFRVSKLIHVPGCLYPVNAPSLRKRQNLLARNERVVLECAHTTGKIFYLVFIGATNVGKIVFMFEPRLETNTTSMSVQVYEYQDQMIEKGAYLGSFKMGSSIALVAQKDFLVLDRAVGEKVRVGDLIACVQTVS
jgi:phosphatidylserine decarboxylase